GLDALAGERLVHLHDVLVVLHLLADVPRHELEPPELGHELQAVPEHLRRRELAVRLALHHLDERLVVPLVEILALGVRRRHRHYRGASFASVAISGASRSSIRSPSSAVASAGAPVYASSIPISRKLAFPASDPWEKLAESAGSARAAPRRTASGAAASTSD